MSNFKEFVIHPEDKERMFSVYQKKGTRPQNIKTDREGQMHVMYLGERYDLDEFMVQSIPHDKMTRPVLALTAFSFLWIELLGNADYLQEERVKVHYCYTGTPSSVIEEAKRGDFS